MVSIIEKLYFLKRFNKSNSTLKYINIYFLYIFIYILVIGSSWHKPTLAYYIVILLDNALIAIYKINKILFIYIYYI